jgi:hypothetical protein
MAVRLSLLSHEARVAICPVCGSGIEIWIFPIMTCREFRAGSIAEDTDTAEAYIVVAVSSVVVVPIGNDAVVGIVVPATAAFVQVGALAVALVF